MMRDWYLGQGDPLSLTIAADTRLSEVDYLNDHIWELHLDGGDPAALAVRTTLGLRARSLRVFPRFTLDGKIITAPTDFAAPPRLRRFYPNFLQLNYSPFTGIEVRADYWAAESHALAGRLVLTNHTVKPVHMKLEMCGLLVPLDGQNLSPVKLQLVNVLAGQAGDLTPVLFLTGGPEPGPGPYPSLLLEIDLLDGATRQFTWALASLSGPPQSFDLARRTAARPWAAERTRIQMVHERDVVDIQTGDPDWDAALALSQKVALGLLHQSEALPHPSFVMARQPDHGYSRKGDGSDYQYLWNGQPPLEACYLSTLLPGAAQVMKGVLKNYLSVQAQDGEIDCKPGLGRQRGKFLAAPLLSSLAWQVYEQTDDRAFLESVFPGLLKFFWAWFSPENDRDRNGIPEWEHAIQTGYEDNPLFNGWYEWAQGVAINSVQTPTLAAMLYREAACLEKMAGVLGRKNDVLVIRKQVEILNEGVQACWDDGRASYVYVDRDTHLSLHSRIITQRMAAAQIPAKKTFKDPVRLLIRIQMDAQTTTRPRITIKGRLKGKFQNETLERDDFRWNPGGAVATSQKVFTEVSEFQVEGLGRKDRILIQTVDLSVEDHTLLVPLWAKLPNEHQAQAIVHRAVMEAGRFSRPYGIPACPSVAEAGADQVCLNVHLPWNQLIGEGLLSYGYREQAARLVVRIMNAVIQNLKDNRAFYQYYHAESGLGIGERNALTGLAPVGLFLKVLGVDVVSEHKVRLEGDNPFPWPVTVKYRGLTVKRHFEKTEVKFSDGQAVTVKDPAPCLVTME
jgi:hypothetical protein